MSAQINLSNMVLQDAAISTVSSETIAVQAVLELQKVAKPQRLQQILASLHYLLTFNIEARDYYFIVDPIDRAILTGCRIGQLEQLINRATNGTVQVHYLPETGEMTISTLSGSLYQFLLYAVTFAVKENIAGTPGFEMSQVRELEMPQFICCIDHNNRPYGLFLLANPGDPDMAAKSIGSVLNNITRNHPSIEMVIRLELGGLDSEMHNDKKDDIEARVYRVAEKSRVQVWVRQNGKFVNDKASTSDMHEGGELRLRLLSENAKGNTVPILKFSEILNVVRNHCKKGVPLTGHPDNKSLQASVFPLDAFRFGSAASTAQLLGLRVVEWKVRGVESKAWLSSLSSGALAMRGMPTGFGQSMAAGCGRHIHSNANNSSLMSLLSARRLLSRLLRR